MNNTIEKSFTTYKLGYTAGVYGCSGEYFNCIINGSKEQNEYHTTSIFFEGMYGVEERIKAVLKDAGYKEYYTQSVYGQLKRKDIPKNRFLSEYKAIDAIKIIL
jgi:hypothetical protein